MKHIFWAIPDRLAGRPGPDEEPWILSDLRAAGFGAVLSVNDGESCDPNDFEKQGILYACVPLSKNAPPKPGDDLICVEALQKGFSFVGSQLSLGRRVLIHCQGGADRTGLFLSYCLMQLEGVRPAAAIERIRQVRPIALSAEGWEDFAYQVLGHFTNSN